MDFNNPAFWVSVVQIIWIDLLLSGDNAVVIALACRGLPPEQRRWGMILGAGAAVGLRILFAFVISYLLNLPFLKVAGGLLLLWIAIKLIVDQNESHDEVHASENLWRAVWTIAVADAVMSLDNVVAIAAAAKGHPELFIFGLLLSIPLIIAGSQIIMAAISRFPILVWAGAALLGWIAGDMLVTDPVIVREFGHVFVHTVELPAKIVGAALVLAVGWAIQHRRGKATTEV